MSFFIKPASEYRRSPVFILLIALCVSSVLYWLLAMYLIINVNLWYLNFTKKCCYVVTVIICFTQFFTVCSYMYCWFNFLLQSESFYKKYFFCGNVPPKVDRLMIEEYRRYRRKLKKIAKKLQVKNRRTFAIDAAGYFTFLWFSAHGNRQPERERSKFDRLFMTPIKFAENVDNDFNYLCTELAGLASQITYYNIYKSSSKMATPKQNVESYRKLFIIAHKFFHLHYFDSIHGYMTGLRMIEVLTYFIKMAFKAVLTVVEEHEEVFAKLVPVLMSAETLFYGDILKILGPSTKRKMALLEEFYYQEIDPQPAVKRSADVPINIEVTKNSYKKVKILFYKNSWRKMPLGNYVLNIQFPNETWEEYEKKKWRIQESRVNKKKHILIPCNSKEKKSEDGVISILEEEKAEEETDDFLLPICIETEKINVKIVMENENYSTSISRIVYDELKKETHQPKCMKSVS